MDTINKWVERIYTETDFARSVATTVSGTIGLVVYLSLTDWVVAAFAAIIAFPIIRLIAASVYKKVTRGSACRIEKEQARNDFDRLSSDEKKVIFAFVHAGGSVLTCSHVNRLSLPAPAVESLMHREILKMSMSADAMTETMVLDPTIFDVAQDEIPARDLP